ncbi:hypothetical protein EXIGLDRAFT_422865 [Exidia glandulosa HHB12029]|uniref:Uncharacterized protein n=1 Tax=Exidia glandulosa HHB12029 TaxID=1314781 RepID=A0A165BDK8_EXIGL|nr:hypothetical protein EXIGLDRAFT_422865 [Exidia glandulosa HHB12029]
MLRRPRGQRGLHDIRARCIISFAVRRYLPNVYTFDRPWTNVQYFHEHTGDESVRRSTTIFPPHATTSLRGSRCSYQRRTARLQVIPSRRMRLPAWFQQNRAHRRRSSRPYPLPSRVRAARMSLHYTWTKTFLRMRYRGLKTSTSTQSQSFLIQQLDSATSTSRRRARRLLQASRCDWDMRCFTSARR